MATTPDCIETDVLIIGYGPVGAALACVLGAHGVRTLVIDKVVGIPPLPRAISLDSDALRILQRVGLQASDFETVRIPHVSLVSPFFGEFVRVDTSGTSDGHPRLVTFHQPDLERALRTRASHQASVTVRCPAELIELHQDGQHVRAIIREPAGQTRTIEARYAVGADGAASRVRSAIGESFNGRTYQEWLVVDARGVPAAIDHVEFICDPRRPTPHMVAPGDRQRWEFMLRPGEARAEMECEEAVRRLIAPWSNEQRVSIDRSAVYRFHARVSGSFQRGRVFLVGDAAHVTPPFVGQGLVAGLRDVANLGWKLAWVSKGWAGPHILDTYDRERRPHAQTMIDLARMVGFLVAPRRLLTSLLVQAGFRLVSLLPGLRRLIASAGARKPSTRYRAGMFVAGSSAAPMRRGTWLPQGWLHAKNGSRTLSDELLGQGLTCVGFGRAVEPFLGSSTLAAWRARGGTVVSISAPEQVGARGSEAAYADLDLTFSRHARSDWIAVVRPDGVLLHDGPMRAAGRVLQESMALLDAPPARAKAFTQLARNEDLDAYHGSSL